MNVDHLLKQSCTVSTLGAQDKFVKTAYGSAMTYACRFQSTSRTIVTAVSEKTPIDGVVWLSATAVAGLNDKLTFAGNDYRIMMISPIVDGAGATRHLELMVQKWNT